MPPACFVGVDVSERRGLDAVILDRQARLLSPPLARLTPDDLTALLAEWRPETVSIDSPPAFGTEGTSRACERELALLGIPCFRTPSDPEKCRHPFYNWMRTGHQAFAAAARAGYPLYAGGPFPCGSALEVFPHAVAVALRGARPPAGVSRNAGAKKRWRLDVLEAAGVDTSLLRTLDAVDATLAALAGVHVARGRWFAVGDPKQGAIILPGERPKDPYPRS